MPLGDGRTRAPTGSAGAPTAILAAARPPAGPLDSQEPPPAGTRGHNPARAARRRSRGRSVGRPCRLHLSLGSAWIVPIGPPGARLLASPTRPMGCFVV